MTDTIVPEGFEPHFRKSPVTDPWEPLFSRQKDGVLEIGLRIAEAHCNARGFLHGGVMASLCDNAMGLTYGLNLDTKGSVVTLSLSVDYVATAPIGAWMTVMPRLIRAGRSMGFVDAIVTADETVVARASATFRNLTG
ncbi:MAG: PaaI family thioesterase [Alphaproteobacteria bacterium]